MALNPRVDFVAEQYEVDARGLKRGGAKFQPIAFGVSVAKVRKEYDWHNRE
jgi:hypothetical protein